MKNLVKCLTAFSFFITHTAWAVSASPQSLALTDRILFEYSDLKSGAANLESYKFQKLDKEIIAKLPQLSKDIKVESKNNWIALSYGDAAAVIQFNDGKILLNGSELNLSPDLSIHQSLKNWSLNYIKNKPTSSMELFYSLFIKPAQAMDPVTYATIVSAGSMENFAMNLAIGEAVYGTSAAASGAVVSTGAAVATIAVGVVAILAIAAVTYCEMGVNDRSRLSTGRQRLNCYAKPLSWIGLNPRENMYLQSIKCRGDVIQVKLENQTGGQVGYEMVFKEEQLRVITDSYTSQIVTTAKSTAKEHKELFEKFTKDSKYYQDLCKDPAKVNALVKKTREAAAQGKIYTDQPKSAVPIAK